MLRIAVTNLWTDRNKGDAAINIATIRVIKHCLPHSKIHAFSYYGANQMEVAKKELYLTMQEDIASFNGGLFPTYDKTEIDMLPKKRTSQKLFTPLIHSIKTLGTITFSLLLLVASRLSLATMLCKVLPYEYRRSLENFTSSDIVVIRTNNIREHESHFFKLYFFYKQFYHAILAIALRKPFAILNVSIWPIKNILSRSLLRWVMNRGALITVREEISHENLKDLKIKNNKVYVVPDFSFYPISTKNFEMKPILKENSHPSIGMVFIDWQEGGATRRRNYINVMTNFIKYLEKFNPKIVIIPQVDYPPENPAKITEEILRSSGAKNVEIPSENLSMDELLKLYSQLDFVIAAPVHACIFALSVGTPAIGIAYEGGPKHAGLMRMLELEKYVLPYDNLTLEKLISLFEEGWQNRLSIRTTGLRNLNLLKEKVLQHGFLLKETCNAIEFRNI
jgi:polysaccharide pyruvyl transferase WcaK-like protein